MAKRHVSTTTTTTVRHIAKPLGTARENGPHLADLREFAAVVGGKKRPDFGHEHDLAVQKALLQACGMT